VCREWLRIYFASAGSKGNHPLNTEWLKNVIAAATTVSAEAADDDRIWEYRRREQEAANREFDERFGKARAK
jgi:hypothetical protein